MPCRMRSARIPNRNGGKLRSSPSPLCLVCQLSTAVEELVETYTLCRTRLHGSDTETHRMLGLRATESRSPAPGHCWQRL